MIVAGGYSGEIQVWNFNSDSDPLIASSGVGSYHGHRDRISSVNWIAGSHLDSRVSRSNFYVLSTGSIKYLNFFFVNTCIFIIYVQGAYENFLLISLDKYAVYYNAI